MSGELKTKTQELIVANKCKFEDSALTMDENMSQDEWMDLGNLLARIYQADLIWIGDWLNFGERKWGEMYAQALPLTGLSLHTLRNTRSIMGRIPKERRLPGLTYSHYALAAPLDEPKRWEILEQAAKEKWTITEMREKLGGNRGLLTNDALQCDTCGKILMPCCVEFVKHWRVKQLAEQTKGGKNV